MRWTPEMRRRAVQGRSPTSGRDTVDAPELHWRGDTVLIRRKVAAAHHTTGERVFARDGPSCEVPDLMPGYQMVRSPGLAPGGIAEQVVTPPRAERRSIR